MQGLEDGGRPISRMSTTVKQTKLDLRWDVTDQSLIHCNEAHCKEKFENNCYFCDDAECTMHCETSAAVSAITGHET